MRICAVIAEYNPFHNGHLKQIEYIKNKLEADKIIVVMSGAFTQRGESAILNKFVRAKHAVMAGADAVIELPTAFATANAELFGAGAVKLLSSIGEVDGLCFGVERGNEKTILATAKALNSENKEFKNALRRELDGGMSFAAARARALNSLDIEDVDAKLLDEPNSILAVEYARSLINYDASCRIALCPMQRTTSYLDETLNKTVSSAGAIRRAVSIKKALIKHNVPKYVYADINGASTNCDDLIMYSLATSTEERLQGVLDCTEGLENRILALAKSTVTYKEFMAKVVTRRYTAARIRRIVLGNMLGINEKLIRNSLKSELYLKVLAVSSPDVLGSLKRQSSIPLIARKSDLCDLVGYAKECYEIDERANDIYNIISHDYTSNNYLYVLSKGVK